VLTLPAAVRIYVAAEAVDLRRGFDGLAAATRSLIREDPLSGHLFVFLNRRKNRIKLLVWDRTGYLLLCTSGWSGGRSTWRRSRRPGSAMSRSMPGSWG
jgi:transposase